MNSRPFPDAAGYRKVWSHLLPFYAFFILFALLTLKLPFFWDKDIFFSNLAHWLLKNHFSPVIPDSLDPGYPPALAYLLALAWKIFGITLPVMHLLMLPFTLGIIWQTRNLLRDYLPEKAMAPALLIMLADTTFLAQTVVYSTDLVMLFFMLLALNSILHNRGVMLVVGVTGLLFSHMRGLTVVATLGLFDLYRNGHWKKPSSWFAVIPPYLPGLALFAGWMLFHLHIKGWIAYHPGSPWAGCYELVNGAGFLKNCAIVIWRLADFGHLVFWIVIAILMIPLLRNRDTPDARLRTILLLLAASLVFTLPAMLIYRMLNGHRYLIPVYYFLSLLAVYLLFARPGREKLKKWLTILTIAGLLSGNFWVYPDKIAKGWDSTLAHLPYHHLRHEMMQYIAENHIPVDETGSRTPNTAVFDCIELNGDQRSFPWADLSRDHYVFYSNVINMFTDDEITALKHSWPVVKEYKCLQVRVTLYRNPIWGTK
jgi:hypothetical protein